MTSKKKRNKDDIHVKTEDDYTPSSSYKTASLCTYKEKHLEVNNSTIQHLNEKERQPDCENQTFTKLAGTSGLSGQHYEIDLVILFLLRGITDKNISNFRLASNMVEAGKFDDVVFAYKYGGIEKSKIIFLQAKHKDKKNTINLKNLFSAKENDDFSLKKYFKSYREIKQTFSKYDKEDHPIFSNNFEDSSFVIYSNSSIEVCRKNILEINIEENSILNLPKDKFKEENEYKCYELILDGSDIEDAKRIDELKYASDCNNLAKELADYISYNKIIDLNNKIFKQYHVPLAEEVIEKNKRNGTLKKCFLDQNDNLSSEATIFREAFFGEMQKLNENRGKSIEDLKLELTRKNIKLHEAFGIKKASSAPPSLPDDFISTNEEVYKFLKKLKLFFNQPNQAELSDIIKQKIESVYKKDKNLIYNDVHIKVMSWWKKDQKQFYLTKTDKLYFKNAVRNCSKLMLVGLAISHNVTIEKLGLSFKMTDKIKNLIHDNRIITIITDEAAIPLSGAKVYQAVKDMDEYESKEYNYKYIFMELNNVLNLRKEVINTFEISNLLVIQCEQVLGNIGELYNHLSRIIQSNDTKKIVLIAQKGDHLVEKFARDFSNNGYEEIHERNSIFDLTIQSQEKLLNETQAIFQGEEVNLSTLIDIESKHLADEVEVLPYIINNKQINVGEAPSDLGETKDYYIDRIFVRHIEIKEDFRREENKFIVYNGQDIPQTDGQEIVSISHVDSDFRELCRNHQERTLHWLKKEGTKLIWQKTRGDLSNLRKFVEVNQQGVARPIDIRDVNERVVIISGKPGMGKSTVLTKLVIQRKEADPSLWIIRINLNDHAKNLKKINFNKNTDTAIDFLMDIIELKTPLETKLFKHRMNCEGKIALFFDGFDEISPDHKEKVEELVKLLLNTKVENLWITTRSRMRKELEDKLNVFSYTMKPLGREDQKGFLMAFWNKELKLNLKNDDNSLNNYIDELLNLLSESISDKEMEFTGVPLHTRMLAEVCQKEFEEFHNSKKSTPDLSVKLNLIDLYQQFIEKKINIYFIEKRRDDISNQSIIDDSEEHSENLILKHKLLALVMLFSDKDVDTLLSPEDKKKVTNLLNRVKVGKEKTGIINQIINDKPSFIHRTFAEYLAASWFAENQNRPKVKDLLCRTWFKEENKVLFYFFDRILTTVTKETKDKNKYKIHIAVLNNDEEAIKECLLADEQQTKNIIDSCDKVGRTALHLAAAYGYSDIVQVLLNFKANFKIPDRILNWEPLKYAYESSHWNVVDILLKNGANGDKLTKELLQKDIINYENPLRIATKNGYVRLAEVLIQNGAIKALDKQGWNALCYAVGRKNLDIVKLLIKNGADVNISLKAHSGIGWSEKEKDASFQTLLHFAVVIGDLDITKELRENGARLDITDYLGRTPLHLAAKYEKLEILKVLAKKEADWNVTDDLGRTPLIFAAFEGLLEVIKVLIEKGAGLNIADKKGHTALYWAVFKGNLNILQLLMVKEIDLNTVDYFGRTPLFLAVSKKNLDVIKLLIENKAKLNIHDDNGETPTHMAVETGNLDIVKLFIESRAELNITDNSGRTPLYWAVDLIQYNVLKDDNNRETVKHSTTSNDFFNILNELIKNGSKWEIADKTGITPLHLAAKHGNLKVLKALLKKRGNINISDSSKQTPLHLAAGDYHNLDVIEELIGKGAKLNIRDNSGETPTHVAMKIGNLDIVKLFIKNGADLNVQNNLNETPLHLAADKIKLDISKSKVHINNEPDLKFFYKSYRTPLSNGELVVLIIIIIITIITIIYLLTQQTMLCFCYIFLKFLNIIKCFLEHYQNHQG